MGAVSRGSQVQGKLGVPCGDIQAVTWGCTSCYLEGMDMLLSWNILMETEHTHRREGHLGECTRCRTKNDIRQRTAAVSNTRTHTDMSIERTGLPIWDRQKST
eukprot:scaffold156394_cov22-Tisochrysis_lutea.AAC.1